MKVAVFFGGKSCEHNISVITGVQTLRALRGRFEAIPVFIDPSGAFWTGRFDTMEAFKKSAHVKKTRVALMPPAPCLYDTKGKVIHTLDAAILATHGFGGEDGCIQGLLTLCGIPFTGSGVAASAVGMDKTLMKKLFTQASLPVLPYVGFTRAEYNDGLYAVVEQIKKNLRFPMIVKPASGGSSIGIAVAHEYPQLFEAVAAGFMWSNAVVVENALTDFTELNCAVLGSGAEITASEIEQPVDFKEFLSYADKYERKGKYKGNPGRVFPADIPQELAEKVKSLARRAFSAIGAEGVARIDFLYDGKQLYVNEINTIPGALSHYLFDKGSNALSFADLCARLVDIALKTKRDADELKYVYESAYSIPK
ncbi:MAG: D-alanine--D-alanine ligase [Firmicutes bacterium]|nr:D-alanine--D-alanine ligase [Bacillota bacterium]